MNKNDTDRHKATNLAIVLCGDVLKVKLGKQASVDNQGKNLKMKYKVIGFAFLKLGSFYTGRLTIDDTGSRPTNIHFSFQVH